MKPVMFTLFGIPFYSYGIMTAVGFTVGLLYALYEAKRNKVQSGLILDISFWFIIASIVGARILFIVVEWDYYRHNLLDIFKIWEGGLVFYGGIILATVVGIVYLKLKKQPVLLVADIFAPALPLGVTFGRVGCFLAGCCYGKPTDLPWGLVYSNLVGKPWIISSSIGLHLHPTQLYSSGAAFFVFLITQFLKKKKPFDGFLVLLTFLLYAIERFIIEFFRGDERGWVIKDYLSTSQFISLIVIGVTGVFLWYFVKKFKGSEKK